MVQALVETTETKKVPVLVEKKLSEKEKENQQDQKFLYNEFNKQKKKDVKIEKSQNCNFVSLNQLNVTYYKAMKLYANLFLQRL